MRVEDISIDDIRKIQTHSLQDIGMLLAIKTSLLYMIISKHLFQRTIEMYLVHDTKQ